MRQSTANVDAAGTGSAGSGTGSAGSGTGSAGSGTGSTGSGIGSAGSGIGSAGSGIGEVGSGIGEAGSGIGEAGSPLRALEAATRAIAAELDLDRVLQLMVDSVRELVRARYAALGIVDEGGHIERFITSGITPEQRAAIGPPPQGHGLLGTIISQGATLRIPDISRHPDAYGFPPNHPVMHSLLGVPVRVEGRPIGNFYLTDKEDGAPFSQDDQDLVELFALHAGIAIQHARLHRQVQALALVDERQRISRDVHDGIIQAVYAVSLSLEDVPELITRDPGDAAERVDRAIDRLHTTIADMRRFISELGSEASRPPLREALEAVAMQLHGESAVSLALDLDGADELPGRLSPEVEHELVQIAREALSNVARHSGAGRATLSLRREDHAVVLRVEDDGVGFEPKRRRGAGHFGLANLRDRAAAVGGTTRIDSAPGRGTRIIVRLPIPEGLSEGESASQ
jgi:signal transduction histidine kinase